MMESTTKPKGYRQGIIAYMNLTPDEQKALDDYYLQERESDPVFKKFMDDMERITAENIEKEKWFDEHIWPQMTNEEQLELNMRSMCGSFGGVDDKGNQIIFMGAWAAEYVAKYRQTMIDKYGV